MFKTILILFHLIQPQTDLFTQCVDRTEKLSEYLVNCQPIETNLKDQYTDVFQDCILEVAEGQTEDLIFDGFDQYQFSEIVEWCSNKDESLNSEYSR